MIKFDAIVGDRLEYKMTQIKLSFIKRIKKLFPTRQQIQNSPKLRFIHKYLYKPKLFEFSRKSITKAVFFGMIAAVLPLPFQSVIVACFAILSQANLIVSLAMVWISNPITAIPFLYTSYWIGTTILQIPQNLSWDKINLDIILNAGYTLFLPVLVGSIILGIASGIVLGTIVWFCFTPINRFIKKSKT